MSLTRPDTLRDKITLIGGILTILTGLFAGAVGAGDYVQNLAHKDEIKEQMQEFTSQNKMSMDAMERRALKRDILRLSNIKNPTDADRILLQQSRDDLEELNKKGK